MECSIVSAVNPDAGHFLALHHISTMGQLMATDMTRISRLYGLGVANFHLLGALMMEGAALPSATDLALMLHVSNAALSSRMARLERLGLLTRSSSDADRPVAGIGGGASGVGANHGKASRTT